MWRTRARRESLRWHDAGVLVSIRSCLATRLAAAGAKTHGQILRELTRQVWATVAAVLLLHRRDRAGTSRGCYNSQRRHDRDRASPAEFTHRIGPRRSGGLDTLVPRYSTGGGRRKRATTRSLGSSPARSGQPRARGGARLATGEAGTGRGRVDSQRATTTITRYHRNSPTESDRVGAGVSIRSYLATRPAELAGTGRGRTPRHGHVRHQRNSPNESERGLDALVPRYSTGGAGRDVSRETSRAVSGRWP